MRLHFTTSSGENEKLHRLILDFCTNFDQSGQISDLDTGILLLRKALVLGPHPRRYVALYNLAESLSIRFRCTGQQVDLDEVVGLHREALGLFGSRSDRSHSLNGFANALYQQFCQTGQQADLDETIVMHNEALELRTAPPIDHVP